MVQKMSMDIQNTYHYLAGPCYTSIVSPSHHTEALIYSKDEGYRILYYYISHNGEYQMDVVGLCE